VTSEDTHYVIARGLRRFRVKEFLPDFPFLVARVEEIGVSEVMTPEVEARMQLLKTRAREAIQLLPNLPPEIAAAVDSLESPSALADFLAGIIDTPVDEKQDLIERLTSRNCSTSSWACWPRESRSCNFSRPRFFENPAIMNRNYLRHSLFDNSRRTI
jgi:ATP-dependent Lon protease